MLSSDTIDKLIQPFVTRQEALNMYVISTICKRINEIGRLELSDIQKLDFLFKGGADIRKINEEIARVTNLQVKEVKSLIKEVAKDSYIYAKPFYDYRHKSFIPFEKNVQLQRIVNSMSKQTEGTFRNLSRASAFMLRDKSNPKRFIPTSIAQTYQKVLDEAVQWVQQGSVDFNTAMQRTISDLCNSGIRYVNYDTPTGRIYTQRLDTAVRRNLSDGVQQLNQQIQLEIGKQVNADGIEIIAHANSAPDHEPIQGRQFTNEQFDNMQNEMDFESYPVKGQKKKYFSAIRRAIGHWNCYHYIISVILNVMPPQYTDKQLQKFIDDNHKGFKYGEQKITMYECTQMQRKYETNIRRVKEILKASKDAGNEKLEAKAKARLSALKKQYIQFNKDCGLQPHWDRTNVFGVDFN